MFPLFITSLPVVTNLILVLINASFSVILAPPTPPPLSRVYVRRHHQAILPVPASPHIEPPTSGHVKPLLLLPPSTSTSADPPPPSTLDIDLLVAIRKVKQNPDGTVDHLKARLVAKGFTQTYDIDYTQTFSPTAKLNFIHIIIFLAANFD
uniref:Reverse transcriptase Ty1/copia-type domain-containing protein n=1 Tax=Fagus sylvatica TaxID=28930 RepID=A0A2N9GAM5_FAGSY